jgi:hypothetical protein
MSNTGGAMTEAEKMELQERIAELEAQLAQRDAAEGKVTETWRVERLSLHGWSRYLRFYESEQVARKFIGYVPMNAIGFRVIHVTTTERIVATRTREETPVDSD